MKYIGSKLVFSILTMLLLILSGACAAGNDNRTELRVLASISLKKPMTEIARAYQEQYPAIKVNLNSAGTGNLVTQITEGAPADVLILATQNSMKSLEEKGLIQWDSQRVLTGNWLALVAPADNPAKLRSFNDLAMDSIKSIALSNPKISASGIYANEVLAYFGISERVKNKLIYCDQVAQIADYIIHGEVDAGILFYTDYLARKDQLSLIDEAPHYSHSPIAYPVALVRSSNQTAEASRFIDWLYSDRSRAILAENGFRITVVTPR